MKLRFAFVAAFTMMTVACSGNNPLEVIVSNCTAVAVLGDAGTVTRFAGSGRDVSDLAYTATISSVMLDCNEHDGGVDSIIEFDIVANSGQALTDRDVSLQYFVAVFKDNSQMVTKEIYDVRLHFNSDGRASAHQVINSVIPTLEQAKRYDYETIIGFQMSNDEAAYNVAR